MFSEPYWPWGSAPLCNLGYFSTLNLCSAGNIIFVVICDFDHAGHCGRNGSKTDQLLCPFDHYHPVVLGKYIAPWRSI